MRKLDMRRFRAAFAAVIILAGCAAVSSETFTTGQQLLAQGRIEEGLATVQKAMEEDPRNQEYRSYYFRQRESIANQLLLRADELRLAGEWAGAEAQYRRVLALDAGNGRARAGLERITVDRRHRALLAEAEEAINARNLDEATAKIRTVLTENPGHREGRLLQRALDEQRVRASLSTPAIKSAFRKPVTLEFREASIRSIFEVISRLAEINFIFDRDVRPDLRASIFVKNTMIEDIVNTLLVTNQLEKKIVNENTILIYPNTPAKARDYQELIVKSFYLANSDAKQALNLIRTIIKTRDIYIDEKLNFVVMRDTPENVRLAEKLIANQDLAEPEVVLELEVAEVKRSALTDIGIQFPNTFTVLNFANTTTTTTSSGTVVATTPNVTTNPLTLDVLGHLSARNIGISPVILNLRSESADTNLLANPRIRVKNRDKARIHIGDRVPVITTTSTANVGVSESVNYLDVGLRLEVEPIVSLDEEVGMKVGLEVSSIVREITSRQGTLTYQIGTRSAATNLRLKDGETQVLAGLISDEDRRSAQKVPGLGDLPIVGRLFRTERKDGQKTEVILLITPHIVRNLARPGASWMEFSSGTEGSTTGSALGARRIDTEALVPPRRIDPVPSTSLPAAPVAPPATRPIAPANAPAPRSLEPVR
ncbi:MAG: secretin N-terminal domain-containing protein [Burkholderiales bacterium]